jgi:hypothetical protein
MANQSKMLNVRFMKYVPKTSEIDQQYYILDKRDYPQRRPPHIIKCHDFCDDMCLDLHKIE